MHGQQNVKKKKSLHTVYYNTHCIWASGQEMISGRCSLDKGISVRY